MVKELRSKTNQLVEDMFEMCVNAGDGHVTSCLSCAEIMTTLYYGGFIKHDPNNPQWEERDRFMLSKAQASPIFYSLLADRGYFNKEEMDKFEAGELHSGSKKGPIVKKRDQAIAIGLSESGQSKKKKHKKKK